MSARAGDRWILFAATAGGVGLSPVAPGTCGTIVAAAVHLLISSGGLDRPWVAPVLAVVATALSIALTPRATHLLGKEDPGAFVLDEVAGYFVAASFVGGGAEWPHILVAFAAFRVFDIAKPPPIRLLERVGGRWGVTIDDLAAGLYAGIIVVLAGTLF